MTLKEFSSIMQAVRIVSDAYGIEDNYIRNCHFAAVDFDSSTEKLSSLVRTATRLRNKLSPHSSQLEGNDVIEIAVAYLDILIECITSRHDISAKLAQQAKGISYGFCAYRKDLKAFERLEKDRQALDIMLRRKWPARASDW